MARRVLKTIPKIKADLIPPAGSVADGVTPDNRQIWKLVQPRSKKEPLLDENGKQIWSKNPQSGEPLVKKYKPIIYDLVRRFCLEDQGNGHVGLVDYVEPSEKELLEAERRRKVAEVKDNLAEHIVNVSMRRGIEPAAVIEQLIAETSAPPEEETEGPTSDSEMAEETKGDGVEFPRDLKGGWYELSNGQKGRFKEDEWDTVITMEAEVIAAREVAETVPEE